MSDGIRALDFNDQGDSEKMSNHLETYLQDHLAGSRFALSLLSDLESQSLSAEAAQLATKMLKEIEADRDVLENIIGKLESGAHPIKELSAWIAQKTGRLKLSVGDLFGVFEAVEFLSLAVLGKRALWRMLQAKENSVVAFAGEDYVGLIGRAEQQHTELESLRIRIGKSALTRE